MPASKFTHLYDALAVESSALSAEAEGNRIEQLDELQSVLGYTFRTAVLLEHALTHKSFVHDRQPPSRKRPGLDYEGLEFLGDAILGFVISEFLYRAYPERPEGELSKMKSFLVSSHQLHKLSASLDLGRFLRVSRGEEKTGGRKKKAILADLFESVVAAVYLDGGIEAARDLILRHYRSLLQRIAGGDSDFKDYKSTLQEQLHMLGLPQPGYRVIRETGPDHQKEFAVEVVVGDRSIAKGRGRSKKEAQQKAANDAIAYFQTQAQKKGVP